MQTQERPNLELNYALASTQELVRELELLEHWLYRYPHMHRVRAWRELASRNTAVCGEMWWPVVR